MFIKKKYYFIVSTGQVSRGEASAAESVTAIKLCRPTEWEVAEVVTTVELLVKPLHVNEWKINPKIKFSRHLPQWKSSGSKGVEHERVKKEWKTLSFLWE